MNRKLDAIGSAVNSIRWSNTPVPEGHVVSLLVGGVLQRLRPRRLFRSNRTGRSLGWPLLLSGVLLAGWAVMTVRDQDIEKPSKLVTTGPYAYSRNPMYLAWHMIYGGIALVFNAAWMFTSFPVLVLFTHFYAIKPEERQLEAQFGEEYRQYCARVGRYL